MQAEQIQALVESAIADSQAQVQIEGNHVHLRVVSPAFAGQSPVKKQQMVYAVLNDKIATGEIHAVHMQTLTPEEAAQ
ncbi:BolA family protein [Gilvimarinus xylanilyticus]|uniref:BolA/IbaG family iron-sulfur metabolism protein n=1 Tax=Gilvimarinus xylanilyticus TaxID=2944139 RepID=A0A9X2I119_9GAMM|nr:BolA/IbaG family iron-sulfur metabolism protein [Gilvimarinus xylanilyticus]MCP8900181.1 BolA/IbaG family iron-sulfur metabolism protein [Gilvimarinus xylanilyticus]